MMVDIRGIDKGRLLMLLYVVAKSGGQKSIPAGRMTVQAARDILVTNGGHLGIINGRILKIDISGDTIDPADYDKANGEGEAARCANILRPKKS